MPINVSQLPADPTERYQALEELCRKELDQTREQLSEIQLFLNQATSEVEKLSQREVTIATRIRDMEINLENYSRADVKTLYTAAHEVSLRLFMMRSQIEQLQSRQQHIREEQEQISLILMLLAQINGGEVRPPAEQPATPAAVEASQAAASLRRIIEAQESERLHVSRYLHDGPAQTLANLVLKAEICGHMIERDATEAKAELEGLRSSLTSTLQETRRLIFDLRPMILDDIGLVPTLRRYLTEIGRGRGFSSTVRGPETDSQLPSYMRALLFRLVQDVVAGVAMRGQLEQVTVDVLSHTPTLELAIDVRAATGDAPAFEPIVEQDEIAQRLSMLTAHIDVQPTGERAARLVITAATPVAA